MSAETIIEISIILFSIIMCLIGLTYKIGKYIENTKKQHDKEILEIYDRITELENQIKQKE